MRIPRHVIVPAILAGCLVLFWALGLGDRLSWAGLAREQATLNAWVSAHPVLAPCLFVVFYTASVTLSLPQAALLTVSSGLFFGTLAGGALAVTGATTGAVFLFLIARSAFGGALAQRGGPALGKLREELRRDGFSYLLAVRLVPVVPFWLVNLAAPLCGMKLRAFALGTLIGIMPTTFVMASIGAQLGGVLARGERPDLSVLFSLPVIGPLLVLAMLSVAPVVWRKVRAHHA